MQAHRRHGQLVLLAELAHLDEVHQVLDVLLDVLEADELLELRHQRVEIGLGRRALLRLLRRLAAGGLHLRVLGLKARLAAGHIVERVEARAGLAHAARVADGREAVGAFGDILGLGIAHVVVHRGEVEQDVREHADEGARGLGAALRVALGEVPVEHRRQEHVLLADRAREAPQQPARFLAAAGIDLVRHRDVPVREPAASAPQVQCALGHKVVQLGREVLRPAEAVKGVGVGDIGLMEFLGRAAPGGRHGRHLLYVLFLNLRIGLTQQSLPPRRGSAMTASPPGEAIAARPALLR